jgi:hypothetical protein
MAFTFAVVAKGLTRVVRKYYIWAGQQACDRQHDSRRLGCERPGRSYVAVASSADTD